MQLSKPTASNTVYITTENYANLALLFVWVLSGNQISGGRSYSDLLDTWADSVSIHQLILKPRSKAACIMYAVPINAQDTLRTDYTSLFTG